MGSTTSKPLPRREDALRCQSTAGERRCVLPADHVGDHVYPPPEAAPPPAS